MNTLFKPLIEEITIAKPLVSQQAGSMSDNSYMMGLLKKIEGYKTKLKELHWAAKNNSTHVRIDEFLDKLSDYEDAIAEDCQGIEGQVRVGTFSSIPCGASDIFEVLEAIKNDLISIKNTYDNNPEYIGVINETEDFFHTLKLYKYLLTISCGCNQD